MRKEDEISWTKAQMFNALNTYQTGLGENRNVKTNIA
jgi:hypothetical protein